MKNQITYTQQGDYLLSNLKLPEQPKIEIGVWANGIYGILKNTIKFAISICLQVANLLLISQISTGKLLKCLIRLSNKLPRKRA